MSTTSFGALPRTNGLDGLNPPRVEVSLSSRCMIGACEVSMPPSRPCSQLHSWITLVTWRCACRRLRPGEFRQRRHVLHRAEIGPDDAAQLAGGIGRQAHLVLEVVFLRLVHHVDAGAGDVELPAVIDAAQPAFLVAAEIERGAAVRAQFVQQADAAVGVAERDKVLAEQADAGGGTIGFGDFLGQQGRNPIAPHGIAHRRARPNPGDEFVVLA